MLKPFFSWFVQVLILFPAMVLGTAAQGAEKCPEPRLELARVRAVDTRPVVVQCELDWTDGTSSRIDCTRYWREVAPGDTLVVESRWFSNSANVDFVRCMKSTTVLGRLQML